MKTGGVKTSGTRPRDTSVGFPEIFPGHKGFLAFAKTLVLDNDQPFALEPFQRLIVQKHFVPWEKSPETLALLPAGNGKSTLLAALGLHHMLTTKVAECIVAAASADQAENIFIQMAGFVQRSELRLDVKRGIRAIYHEGDGPNRKPLGRIRVIAADEQRASGVIPSLVLVDELQAHPNGHLYNVLQQRLNKRHAKMLTISNAGWEQQSFLHDIRKQAHAHESFTRTGMLNQAQVGSMEFLEWCLGDGDSPHDLRAVKRANPLRSVKLQDLKVRHESGGLLWPEWLRATCGIWTIAKTQWIQEELWDARKADIGNVQDGDEVYVAIRAGAGIGIGIVSPRDDGRVAVDIEVIPPPPNGRVALRDAEHTLRRICERYKVKEIAYDYDQFGRSAELLEEAGLPMEKIPQSPKMLAIATTTLWRLISGGLLQHDGNSQLRGQVLAGEAKDGTSGWRLVPTAETAGLIALAMAVNQATQKPAPTKFWVILGDSNAT
jgi:phage terminase large subunit-like protein